MNENPEESTHPKPARPPARPPMSKHVTSSKPTTAVNGVNGYMNVDPETTGTVLFFFFLLFQICLILQSAKYNKCALFSMWIQQTGCKLLKK